VVSNSGHLKLTFAVSPVFSIIHLWNYNFACVSFSLFHQDYEDFSAWETISELVKFVDRIIVAGLQQERFNIILTHFVLQFFEEVKIVVDCVLDCCLFRNVFGFIDSQLGCWTI
jgi:hypothetical protein